MLGRCIPLVVRPSLDGLEERACFRVASKEGELVCLIPPSLPFFLFLEEVMPPDFLSGVLQPSHWMLGIPEPASPQCGFHPNQEVEE